MMPGLGLGDLRRPIREFDPARIPKFETFGFCANEDRLVRGPGLLRVAQDPPPFIDGRAARRLGRSLVDVNRPDSLASSRKMRRIRRRVIGEIWRFHMGLGEAAGTTFHLVGENSTVSPEALMGTSALALRNAMRSCINRVMKFDRVAYPSALIAFLHGEFDLLSGTYSLHWHGYACGAHLTAIERLRGKSNKFAPGRDGDGRDAIARPIMVERAELDNPARALSYALKSYWPAVPKIEAEDGGKPRRVPKIRRIPEPHHSLHLLWLDQWKIADISLMMGMRVTRKGLTLKK